MRLKRPFKDKRVEALWTNHDPLAHTGNAVNIRHLSIILLVGAVLLASCRGPAPAARTRTPAAPEATPAQPAGSPTGVSPIAVSPTPPDVSATGAPAPTEWPVILGEVSLDLVYDPGLYPRPLAVDSAGSRVYVSGAPSQTVVLSADDWSVLETWDAGGNLALDTINKRLFIGTPAGLVVYNIKSGSRLTQIALVRPHGTPGAIPQALTTPLPATPLAGELSGDVYAAQYRPEDGLSRLYRISPVGLYASVISESRNIQALALNEQRAMLYASIDNGIPGSNNRNDLWAVDLRTHQSRRMVLGVRDAIVDGASDRLIVALSARLTTPGPGDVQIWSGEPLTLTRRLFSASGLAAADGPRDRLYLLDGDRLMVLQEATLALVADVALPGVFAAMALDAQADRLYLLSEDGHLLIVGGHGGPAPWAEAAQSPGPAQPPAMPVARLIASPAVSRDKTIAGLWSYSLLQGGVLLLSKDGGLSWTYPGSGLPGSSNVTDVAFAADGTMFAATLRGVYRSADGGQTWQPASAGLRDLAIMQLAISPDPGGLTLYARAREASVGLHRTSDGGQTWASLASRYAASPGDQAPSALALAPDAARTREQAVFLSTRQDGSRLMISQDGGKLWTRLADATAMALHPSPGFAQDSTLFGVFEQQGLMRSTDGGKTWHSALRGVRGASSRDSLALSPNFEQDRTAFLLTREPARLYRTSNGGESWQVSTSALVASATALAVSDTTVWMGMTDGRVVMTAIGELGWKDIPPTAPDQWETVAMSPAFDQDQTLFAATRDAGVWVSTDGKTWRDTGFPAREVGIGRMHLAVSPDWSNDHTLFAATGSQLYRSTDGGDTWQLLPVGRGNLFPIHALAISPDYAGDRMLLVAGDYRAPTVLRSTDGGDTWQSDGAGLPAGAGLNHLAFSPNFSADRGVYVWAEAEGLYRSGDGGQTWTRVYKPTGSWLIQSFALSPDFERDRLMFLGTLKENHNVYRSADGGASWHPAELGLPLELLWASALALSPDFGRDRELFLGTDQGVYRSDDGGQMWRLAVSLPEITALLISPGLDGHRTLLALSAREGLYISTDGGDTWLPVK